MQTECLVEAPGGAGKVQVSVRFLQPMSRAVGRLEEPLSQWPEVEPAYEVVPELRVGDECYPTWHEAVERRVEVPWLQLDPRAAVQQRLTFAFPGVRRLEPILDGRRVAGVIVRRQFAIQGRLEVDTQPLGSGLFRITTRVVNESGAAPKEEDPAEALLLRTLASTHTVLCARGGQFISLLDPPAEFQEAVRLCKNIGTWPVLIGEQENRDREVMLSSPIILYDYPQIADESAGPLFDGTEIDEILTLRILTLTEEERREMRRVDAQARRLLERTESLSDNSLLKLHGAMRSGNPEQQAPALRPADASTATQTAAPVDFDDFFGPSTRLEGVVVRGIYLKPGARVRIWPKARADVLDLALCGQTAVVEAVEQDAERRVHLGLVLENDPGKDLGLLRQPGHRFFYGVDEVEPLTQDAS